MAKKIELKADSVDSVKTTEETKETKAKKTASKAAETTKEPVEEVQEETPATKKRLKKVEKEETVAAPEEAPKNEETLEEKPARKRKKLDEMTEAERIALHAERSTYSVQKADKDTKKELYSSIHVVTENGEEDLVETDATIRKEEWLELVASASEDRPLKGKLMSITEVASNSSLDDPDYVPEYMAKVKFGMGNFVVNIPSYVLYYYDYYNLNRAMASDIQRNMERRLGADIDFVVRYCDEKTGYVIGDHLAALSMRGVRNYAPIDGRKPRVLPGDENREVVQARIVAIAHDYILVDALGAEIKIPLDEISWLYVSDARDFDGVKTKENYFVGAKVNVKILSVAFETVKVRNSKYTLVKATGSIKQTKPNPRLLYFDEFNIGDIYAGVVTGINESGVYVNIDGRMDCLCKFPKDSRLRIPVLGDNVVVKINGKDEEKKFIYGKLK